MGGLLVGSSTRRPEKLPGLKLWGLVQHSSVLERDCTVQYVKSCWQI